LVENLTLRVRQIDAQFESNSIPLYSLACQGTLCYYDDLKSLIGGPPMMTTTFLIIVVLVLMLLLLILLMRPFFAEILRD
jgi:hypothetical protein